MEWAQDAGYAHCTLQDLAAIVSGARFWERSGFLPLAHRLSRCIDERIAWAAG